MEYHLENFNGEYDFRSHFHDGYAVNAHIHEYSEILYCKKGEGQITINGQVMHISKDQLIWLPPNYVHQYDCSCAQVICAVFSNDFIPLFFKALAGRYFCVSPVDMPEMSYILEEFPELKKEDYMKVSGYLNLICSKVMKHSSFESARHTDGILYQKVISFISEHYAENITLSSIAKKFGYNEKYLSHSLHELTGINFRQFLTFYRINHAKRLLENEENTNITTIATESGFCALNTFHRAFKATMGITPSEYRQNFTK